MNTNIRKANNFLLLLTILVLMLSVFLILNLSSGQKISTNQQPTPTVVPTEALLTDIQLNINSQTPIKSPFTLTGKIDNSWLFEGQFQLELQDSSNVAIFDSPVMISSGQDWTIPGMKDFSISLKFKTNDADGVLVIKSDNPSGIPENQKIYSIPVKFTK